MVVCGFVSVVLYDVGGRSEFRRIGEEMGRHFGTRFSTDATIDVLNHRRAVTRDVDGVRYLFERKGFTVKASALDR